MTKIQADMCDCCKEIWNKNNLKNIKVGKHILHFCSDCFTEYVKPLDNIRTEIENEKHIGFTPQDFADGLDMALEIIDKYKAERCEK